MDKLPFELSSAILSKMDKKSVIALSLISKSYAELVSTYISDLVRTFKSRLTLYELPYKDTVDLIYFLNDDQSSDIDDISLIKTSNNYSTIWLYQKENFKLIITYHYHRLPSYSLKENLITNSDQDKYVALLLLSWEKDDKPYRKDGPCYESYRSSTINFTENKLISYKNPVTIFWNDDVMSRYKYTFSDLYYKNKILHRTDGPALTDYHENGSVKVEKWCIDGNYDPNVTINYSHKDKHGNIERAFHYVGIASEFGSLK